MPRLAAAGLLLVTTMLWGFAFVAQKTAMDNMEPLTFTGVRFAIGALLVLPLAVGEYRRRRPVISTTDRILIGIVAVAFFLGSWLQQAGLSLTTVTNSGFLTSLYVLMVPILALVVLRQSPHPVVWIGMPMALAGVWCLNGGRLDAFNPGDLLVIACAVCWAVQVLLLGRVAKSTGLPLTVSVLCFAVTGLLAGGGAFAFETPTWDGIAAGWLEIAYAAVLSTAVGFTLQAVAQQYVPPSNAAIILSAEGLFAALGAAVLLGERLTLLGYAGTALIFAAILLVEVIPALRARGASAADAVPLPLKAASNASPD